jgi:hypothetical protein
MEYILVLVLSFAALILMGILTKKVREISDGGCHRSQISTADVNKRFLITVCLKMLQLLEDSFKKYKGTTNCMLIHCRICWATWKSFRGFQAFTLMCPPEESPYYTGKVGWKTTGKYYFHGRPHTNSALVWKIHSSIFMAIRHASIFLPTQLIGGFLFISLMV